MQRPSAAYLSVIAMVSFTLCGCGYAPPLTSAGEAPLDYIASVRREIGRTFRDPDSLKSASLSEPFRTRRLMADLGEAVWAVCLDANAKNAYGGYTGQSYTLFFFVDGNLVGSSDEFPQDKRCDGRSYRSFTLK